MEIIPAIDVMDGKCVRLTKGKYGTEKIYGSDPLKIALTFQKAGVKEIHLVDLDGAREGKVKNWRTIEIIAEKTKLKLQAGGGFRTEQDIKRLLRLGSHEVMLGTIVLESPRTFRKLFKKFGEEKIAVDVAVKRNRLYARGWQEKTEENLLPFLEKLARMGVKTVVCTDIGRDGALEGPNFSLYRSLAKKFPTLQIIASGGVRNVRDLKKLEKTGVAGAIIGRAIYEKKIWLPSLTTEWAI